MRPPALPIRALALPALLIAAATLPGCIIVHREVETRYPDSYTSTSRTRLGVVTERPDPATAAQLNVDRDRAALITHVVPGSPAERAGLLRYDVITAINEATDVSSTRLRDMVRTAKPGEPLRIAYLRHGQAHETTATLD